MNRSRSQLDTYHSRPLSLHKPGFVPNGSQNGSPIMPNRHKYELKQKVWSKQTVESWFAKHSFNDRRVVFSFLNSLYDGEDDRGKKENPPVPEQRQKSPTPRLSSRVKTASAVNSSASSSQRRSASNHGRESRASKRDLGDILESLQSFRPSSTAQDKGIQTSPTSTTVPLPEVNGTKTGRKIEKYTRRSVTSLDKHPETVQPPNATDEINPANNDEDSKLNRRYLSTTWRVINPREDMEPTVRPENNRSSFFNYTKKVYPEYFFIHPDWY